jgi:phosphatidylserine/phosphatidylglycerophosphate/cardiolipin synthase-like enzyme
MHSKKDLIYIIIITLLLAAVGQLYYSYRYIPNTQRQVDIYYNQNRELNREIIKLTQDADEYIYFAVYTFTRNDIKDALLAANYRKVKIVGLIDKEQSAKIESQGKIVKELRDAGIPIYEQDHSAIMHLKTIVTEKAYASGSYNWTAAATNLNDEVLEVGRDEELRKKYEAVLLELFRRYKDSGK